jgi:hypothetical protein
MMLDHYANGENKSIMSPKRIYVALSAFFLLAACTTGFHGSFAPQTYIGNEGSANSEIIGPVKGQSCQTRVLYLFPDGNPPSTAEAIQAAKNQYEGTKYLTDVSIDDRTEWEVGYSRQCITVEGIAHR